MKVGLRFDRRDARPLRALADRVRGGEVPGAEQVFESAAQAAELGEPLVVICEQAEEANQMADGYTLYGIGRPAVEGLTG